MINLRNERRFAFNGVNGSFAASPHFRAQADPSSFVVKESLPHRLCTADGILPAGKHQRLVIVRFFIHGGRREESRKRVAKLYRAPFSRRSQRRKESFEEWLMRRLLLVVQRDGLQSIRQEGHFHDS